ncbi:extracellular solute-binding protein [Gracilibacillus salitolerans]|uniref:Extracellular solute-binding protein n=1 Tax=Gracilibacillus salitolerans TaxID=2663022 RepID=A0A5Q2THU3_9BACI|nr:extracellular solute-binding protein [Gracilibacillus salitolerans]QGH33533.1 extracellular solute-binding protein [Gracilibacillus salitolerans]
MRKLIILVLSLVFIGLVVSGCSNSKDASKDYVSEGPSDNFNEEGFPIVEEQITLKFFARKSPPNGPYNEMKMFNEYEQMTNIDIDWDDVPQDGFQERKSLEFSSGELPDAFYKSSITPLEAVEYGSSGVLIPLEGLLEEYAPNLTALYNEYPEIKSSITAPDGHIYALPAILTLNAARTDKIWINKTWLNNLELEAPTTPDELVSVLEAFRDNDPNGNGEKDEIPMTFRNFGQLLNSMIGSWGMIDQMGNHLMIEDGKVQFWMTDNRFKEYLQFLHKLYDENLMDRGVFTQEESNFVGNMASGNVGIFWNQTTDAFNKVKDDYTGISPIIGPDGDQLYSAGPIARDFGTFAITSKNEHPQATMRWIDHFFSEEGSIFFRYGIEGDTFHYDEEGLPEYTDEVLNSDQGLGPTIGQFTPWPGGGSPQFVTEKNASAINPPEAQEAQEMLDPFLPDPIYGTPIFDEDTTKEVDQIRQDMDQYFEESASKFITGDLSFDKWDDYVSTIEGMGLDRLTEIYQEAYDRTN